MIEQSASKPLDVSLWYSVGTGNSAEMRSLLAKGANPNFRGDKGRTPVHRASMLNCLDESDLLVGSGGSINSIDDERETPLHLAARYGNLSLVKRLIEYGAEIEQWSDYGTPLFRASYGGNVDVAATLIKNGASVTKQNSWGRTPLHEAVKYGNIEVARLFLRRGADVDAVDQYGNSRTPLHEGLETGDGPFVELLLEYGANIQHKNSWGATPLHMAARSGATDCVEFLLTRGAETHIRDNQGNTPLDEAIINNKPEIISLLKKQIDQIKYKSIFWRKINSGSLSSLDEIPASSTEIIQKNTGFCYNPDGKLRIERIERGERLLFGGQGFGSLTEIVSEVKVIPLEQLAKLSEIKRHQDLDKEIRWLSIEDDPLLIIFISHRWEHSVHPDPYGTQLWVLKNFTETFLQIAENVRKPRDLRINKVPSLRTHGALQAAYFDGVIADFIDSFSGSEADLRQQLQRRVGIVYDYMSLPQLPLTPQEDEKLLNGIKIFRRLMSSTHVLALRYPDDDYSSRSWCELEFWSAGQLHSDSFFTVPVLRTDKWGKEIQIRELSPPITFNSSADFDQASSAISDWEEREIISAEDTLGKKLRDNYHLAFSYSETKRKTPLVTRPEKKFLDAMDAYTMPPSFRFWYTVNRHLCEEGINNSDLSEVLKEHMMKHGLACTEERDLIPTALWLLGCHENIFDSHMMKFYGRCLLRYFEGKDLVVKLFPHLNNQNVYFKFADGEEAME